MPSFEMAWLQVANFLVKLLLWIVPRQAKIVLSHLWGNYLQSKITRDQQEINRAQQKIDQIDAEYFAGEPLETRSWSEFNEWAQSPPGPNDEYINIRLDQAERLEAWCADQPGKPSFDAALNWMIGEHARLQRGSAAEREQFEAELYERAKGDSTLLTRELIVETMLERFLPEEANERENS
jgi:hypothetical protein